MFGPANAPCHTLPTLVPIDTLITNYINFLFPIKRKIFVIIFNLINLRISVISTNKCYNHWKKKSMDIPKLFILLYSIIHHEENNFNIFYFLNLQVSVSPTYKIYNHSWPHIDHTCANRHAEKKNCIIFCILFPIRRKKYL